MPKFIKIDNNHIAPGRIVRFTEGDIISISFQNKLSGFGLHFAPFQNHQAFNIRSINSSVGLDTYAPSQRFTLDENRIRIYSGGDETIEVAPYRSGSQLVIRAKHGGYLAHDKRSLNHYKPPLWAYDYWFSTPWTRLSQNTVMQEIKIAHQHHLDPKIWLIDAGWSSKNVYMNFDTQLFPDGNNFMKIMHDHGVKPILWLSPFIDEKTKLWHEFDKNNWLVKCSTGKSARFAVTGDGQSIGSYIDYTSRSFLDYLAQRITELKTLGLSGIMFDFGESLPDDSKFCLETDSAKQAYSEGIIGHNWYVGEIKRVLGQIAKPLGLCIISRSGWTDSYSQTGLWLGDQSSDMSRFAGLESLLWGYKTAHDAGYRFIGMDAGGYFGQSTVSDYKKWLDLSVTMPFTMLHGAIQSSPWEEGEEALSHFRKCRKLHNDIWINPEDVKVSFRLNRNKQKVQKVIADDFQFLNDSGD